MVKPCIVHDGNILIIEQITDLAISKERRGYVVRIMMGREEGVGEGVGDSGDVKIMIELIV